MAGTWALGSQVFAVTDKGDSVCLGCLCEQRFMLNTCFPSGGVEVWDMRGRGCLGPACNEALGAVSLMGVPGRKGCTHIGAFLLLGEE